MAPSTKLIQPVLYACLCLRSDCSLFLLCVFACACCFRSFECVRLVLQSRDRGQIAHRFGCAPMHRVSLLGSMFCDLFRGCCCCLCFVSCSCAPTLAASGAHWAALCRTAIGGGRIQMISGKQHHANTILNTSQHVKNEP